MRPGWIWVATGLLACLWAGCGSEGTSDAAPSAYRPKSYAHDEVPWPKIPPNESELPSPAGLKQLDNGPGVVVGEPAGSTANPRGMALGAGAARWLQVVLGGHASFNRAPSFDASSRLNLRHRVPPAPRPAQCRAYYASTGTPHLVTTEVTDSEEPKLVFRLMQLPTGRPVGAPIVLSGRESRILGGLPGVAVEIASRLGVSPWKVPPPVETAEDLRFLGRVARPYRIGPPAATMARLAELAGRSAVAGVLLVESSTVLGQGEVSVRAARSLLEMCPESPLCWAEAAAAYSFAQIAPSLKNVGRLRALRDRYPDNALLRLASGDLWGAMGHRAEAVAQTCEAIRRDADNPYLWLRLSGRLTSQIEAYLEETQRQSQGLQPDRLAARPIFERVLEAGKRLVELDPQSSESQIQLALASARLGDEPEADRALWRALRAQDANSDVVSTAEQIYGRRWFARGDRLRQFQEAAAAATYASPAERSAALELIRRSGRQDLVAGPGQKDPSAGPRAESPPARAAMTTRRLSVAQLAQRRKLLDTRAERAAQEAGLALDQLLASEEAPSGEKRPTNPALGGRSTVQHIPGSRVLLRQKGPLFTVAWNRPKATLAAAGRGGAIRIWNRSGSANPIPGHWGSVYALEWSPDGRSLAAAGADGVIRIWDVAAGRVLRSQRRHAGPVRSLSWAPSGLLASGGDDGSVCLWTPDGTVDRVLKASTMPVGCVEFRPDGGRLLSTATSGLTGEARLWNPRTGEETGRFVAPISLLQPATWSPDGRQIALGGPRDVSIFDAESLKPAMTVQVPNLIALALLWEGDVGLVGSLGSHSIRPLVLGPSSPPHEWRLGVAQALALAWDAGSGEVFSANSDGTLRSWNVKGSRPSQAAQSRTLPPAPDLISPPLPVRGGAESAERMMNRHLSNGRLLECIAVANHVIRNGGSLVARAYSIRGTAEGRLGESALAVQDFEAALKSDPAQDTWKIDLAWWQYEAGDLRAAAATGESVTVRHAHSAVAWFNLALCYAALNEDAKSESAYAAGLRVADAASISGALYDLDEANKRHPNSRPLLERAIAQLRTAASARPAPR